MIPFVAYISIVSLVLLGIKCDKYPKEQPHAFVILSGSTKYITNFRLLWAVYLITKHNYQGKVYVCGKEFGSYMRDYLHNRTQGIDIEIVNTNNTFEDARFTRKLIETDTSKFVLITSLSHQTRAYTTFKKAFNASQIINCPTWYDVGSWFSPLLPTGWAASIINTVKNYQYNQLRSRTY